jgi:hypothetical protein
MYIFFIQFSATDFIKVCEKLIFNFGVSTDTYAVILSAKLNTLRRSYADRISQIQLLVFTFYYQHKATFKCCTNFKRVISLKFAFNLRSVWTMPAYTAQFTSNPPNWVVGGKY